MSDRDDDAELVARAEHGDISAFDQLVDRYRETCVNSAFTILGERRTAQNCAHEALLEALGSLSKLKEKSKFGNWAYAIARRNAIRILRRRKARAP